MSIESYIESLTKIDKSKTLPNINWQKNGNRQQKPCALRGKGVVPYQIELDQWTNRSTTQQRDKKYYRENKTNKAHHNSKAKYDTHRFADIISCVREVGVGYNTFSNDAILRRFKENEAKNESTEESNSSTTSVTVNSKSTEESYKTALENLDSLKLSTDDSKNEVSISDDSEERYKKNALITGLLHTQNHDFSDIDKYTEMSSDKCSTSLDIDDVEEDLDEDESDESLYKGRIIRFFQSAEDEDVYVHPLKEQIQKDPEWQKFKLRRKGVELIQTPRSYYLNLDDESFDFQPRKSA